MKLIGIYIENFGCLHQYELTFSDGLTVIREDNGFGKTTLAEFIRAMFYGFPRAAKTLDKNRRKKYLPWSGGKCGGHLTFEVDGTRYRVERTFGATPRTDTFTLIDLTTNQKSTRFSEELGVELFQLDADSFERSTYMPQLREMGPLSTDSIRAKLGDLVEDTNDVGNFDKAVTALKNKRSTYVPYRGNGGSVAEARTNVSRIQEELDAAAAKKTLLAQIQAEQRILEQDLEQKEILRTRLGEEIAEGAQAVARAALRRQQAQMTQQIDQLRGNLDHRFDGGIPQAEAFEQARRDCESYLAETAQLKNVGIAPGEQTQLEELTGFFAPGVPDDEKLENLSRQHHGILQLQLTAQSRTLSAQEQRQLEELGAAFASGAPEQSEIDDARMKLERRQRLEQEIAQMQEALQSRSEKSGGSAGAVIALVLGVLMGAAGVGLMVGGKTLLGGIALGVGLLAMVAGGFLGIRRMISREVAGNAAPLREQIAASQAEYSRLEWEVRDFVRRYVRAGEEADGLTRIQQMRTEYLSLNQRKQELEFQRQQVLTELSAQENALKNEISPYFRENVDFEQAILTLRMKRGRFEDLQAKSAEQQLRIRELEQKIAACGEMLRTFLEPWYGAAPLEECSGLLNRLARECDGYLRTREQLAELEERLARFYAEHGQIPPEACEAPDLEALKQQERELVRTITEDTRRQLERKQQIDRLGQQIDRIPELEDSLEQWRQKKDADQNRADTLDRTLEFLQQARERLSGNYLSTIQRSFGEYLGRLTGEDRQKILVTSDLEVQLERQGKARELGYFSAGQSDLVMLCMRFALVDALFGGEKPFVILDDPFVNLDDERTAQALALVKELAQDRQIIYLVCNSSRM